jgi:hypothetical protein
MRDYTKRLPGQVTVLDRPNWTYEEVFARFSNFGIGVPRLEPSSTQYVTGGPHFTFDCLSAIFFINSIYRVHKTSLEYKFSGDYLGHIDSLTGYAAADMGTETFPITLLTLRADFYPEETLFKIFGKCGDGLAWTFHGKKSPNWSPQFEITFSVSDSNLSNFFDQEYHVDAFKRNRESCIFGI